MNSKVDTFFKKEAQWRKEMELLRALVLDCGLVEELKWRVPCYTYNDANVLIIHGFKNYCALNFFKGALLADPEQILVQQSENSQSARQLRFSNLETIEKIKATITAYVFEAIEVENAGLKVQMKKTSDFEIPEELKLEFESDTVFKQAFDQLTEGRKRGYILHFSQPKQSKTRVSRIERSKDKILNGYGLNDCTCGLSKRKPSCDGSHKVLKQKNI